MSAVPVAKSVFEARGLRSAEPPVPRRKGARHWTSFATTRRPPSPARRSISPARSGSPRASSAPIRPGSAAPSSASRPGARTAWHTHPLGQTLIVTTGQGWIQREGGPVEEIRPGDVVWIPPGEKHWHGATATTAMTHVAVSESLDGKSVDWLEHVTDEQYGAR